MSVEVVGQVGQLRSEGDLYRRVVARSAARKWPVGLAGIVVGLTLGTVLELEEVGSWMGSGFGYWKIVVFGRQVAEGTVLGQMNSEAVCQECVEH